MQTGLLSTLIDVLEWAGTFAFALSGGLLGVTRRLDLFGVLFLSLVAAVGGGVVRDVLIGAVPPAALTEIRYFVIATIGGLATFFWYPRVVSMKRRILLLDAAGLALFAVVGAQKALEYGINPLMAAVMGMLTGIGGGMMRDVLAGEVPLVLREDVYAVAALAAGCIVALGAVLGLGAFWPMLLGAAACTALRLLAIYRGWRAPVARWGGDDGGR